MRSVNELNAPVATCSVRPQIVITPNSDQNIALLSFTISRAISQIESIGLALDIAAEF